MTAIALPARARLDPRESRRIALVLLLVGGVVLYLRFSVGWNGDDGAETPIGLEGAGVVNRRIRPRCGGIYLSFFVCGL